MEYLNKMELEIKERLRSGAITDEDVEYLLEMIKKSRYNLDCVEMKLLKKEEEYESLEILLDFQTKAKKKLISQNTMLLNDINYFTEILKSISRIAVPEDKGDPDLEKIKNLADEALEGI